uniref:ZAD domain-containing protein n=1 Tax=Glossina brevipalpis TaxID=37001 RepID=A0A1A9W9U4_9MUSC
MSENSSEYLKRTCLICGCHTNQTINIYEPRNGPNIVDLIQAKFKFQPLNEDKYLCFSCNNWLINWHSLQALNSNEADSSSGTFRASVNSGNNSVMQTKLTTDDNAKRPIAICRPIRRVPTTNNKKSITGEDHSATITATTTTSNIHYKLKKSKPKSKTNFKKSQVRLRNLRRSKTYSTQLRLTCSCGRTLLLLASDKRKINSKFLKRKVSVVKCLKCKANDYLKSSKEQNLVNITTQTRHQDHIKCIKSHKTFLRKPLIDGKVVAMLRRIGTTLSRESIIKSNNDHNNAIVEQNLPQIMSPTKPKQRWSRPLTDDEIVLNFDATIAEVLPDSLTAQITDNSNNTSKLRKRLTYHMSSQEENFINLSKEYKAETDAEDEDDMNMPKTEMSLPLNLPKGLSITLV